MFYDQELLDYLEGLGSSPFEGSAYRHMFLGFSPERANIRGARWNPPDVSAIYTSTERSTALAEAEYQMSIQPFRPSVSRDLYDLSVVLTSVLDLRDSDPRAGITPEILESDDLRGCQRVGGAVEWLGHDGLLVPSFRAENGSNLVIFPRNQEVPFKVLSVQSVQM